MVRLISEPYKQRIPNPGRVFTENGLVFFGRTLGDYLGGGRWYDPFDYPNLPNALARVYTEKDVVDFVQAYGMLGYRRTELPEGEKTYRGFFGEPVDWILSQARTVRFALRIINALQFPGDAVLLDVLKTECREIRQPSPAEWEAALSAVDDDQTPLASYVMESLRSKLFGFSALNHGGFIGSYTVTVGSKTVETGPLGLLSYVPPEAAGRPHATRKHAQELLAFMINQNTAGIKRYLVVKDGKLTLRLGAWGLIEVIWHHVGEAALVAQHRNTAGNVKSSGIRECEECGTPFLLTDQRQRFCPNPFGGPSLCGNRNRQRRYHKKKREGS